MKKFFLFCGVVCAVFCATDAFPAAKVLMPKKADAVAKRDSSTTTSDAAASVLPTVVGLVGTAMTLSQQQKALIAECEPTSQEVTFVNNMVKEWANAGAANPMKSGRYAQCGVNGNSTSYKTSVRGATESGGLDTVRVCWDVFTDAEARGAVWAGFPKADVAEYCTDGSYSMNMCGKNSRKKFSNLWDIWSMINFDKSDFTVSESSKAEALNEKAKKCSPTKISERRMEQFGDFVTGTIGNIGKNTNTGTVMDAVSGVVKQTGIGGTLGGLAPVVGQFLDK